MAPKNVKAYLHNTNFHGIGLDKFSVSMPLSKQIVSVVTAYFVKYKVKELVDTQIPESYGRPLCTIADETPKDIEYENDNDNSLKTLVDLKLLLPELDIQILLISLYSYWHASLWSGTPKERARHDSCLK